MYFTYIDWVKERMTKEQKAEINTLENEYQRAVETLKLMNLDKDTLFDVICSLGDKLAKTKHRCFEETHKRLNKE